MEENTLLSNKDLLHFTKSISNLKGIIENGFYMQFSREELVLFDKDKDKLKRWAIPMICFCDIPFELILNHIGIYGGYGIGISKLYGSSAMKLNPVIYLDDSDLKLSFEQLVKYVIIDRKADDIGMSVYNIIKYIKRYKGDYYRNGRNYTDYKFYDEREWRYVPAFQLTGNFITEENFNSIESENQNLMNNGRILFDLKDVNFIFVKNELEINEIAEFVKLRYKDFDIKKINTIHGFMKKQKSNDSKQAT